MTPDEIDEIVLVGGSTKIRKIQAIIQDSFKKSKIIKSVNVDECVAIGAALEAAKITKIAPENFRVTEVTPFSLGTDFGWEQRFSKIVPRFTQIPLSKSDIYHTLVDNQTVGIHPQAIWTR